MLETGPLYHEAILKLIASVLRSASRGMAVNLFAESNPDSPAFVLMRALQGNVCGGEARIFIRFPSQRFFACLLALGDRESWKRFDAFALFRG